MTQPSDETQCKCGGLARMAEDPKDPVEFDPQLNEYHITRKSDGGYSVVYFCPLCGGKAPPSKRSSLVHRVTDAERERLSSLTKDLRTVSDVIKALGQPDMNRPVGMTIITPEKEGAPETAQNYPLMVYSGLSDSLNVHVTVYPNDKVGISFQGKPILVKQTQEIHFERTAKPPEPGPQIDTQKRYDVYCIEPSREVVVYRNALFKGASSLLPGSGGRIVHQDFVELEQANGQPIFISRSSIFRFCEPGTSIVAESLTPNEPDVPSSPTQQTR